MRCHVLLFAGLAESIGQSHLTLELETGATVGDAVSAMAQSHEPIARQRERLAVAVNEVYRRRDWPLHDGDTLALIMPVSGG